MPVRREIAEPQGTDAYLKRYCQLEFPRKFRLPRVTYTRSHHERGDDEDTEAGRHRRVQGTSDHASSRRADSRSGSQRVGAIEQMLGNWVRAAAEGRLNGAKAQGQTGIEETCHDCTKTLSSAQIYPI